MSYRNNLQGCINFGLPKFATFLVSPFQYIEWLQMTAKIISSVLQWLHKMFPAQ